MHMTFSLTYVKVNEDRIEKKNTLTFRPICENERDELAFVRIVSRGHRFQFNKGFGWVRCIL